jgi:hypothetical protein
MARTRGTRLVTALALCVLGLGVFTAAQAAAENVAVTHYSCPSDNSNNGHYVPANHYWEQDFTVHGTGITGGYLLLGANQGDHDHTAHIGIYTGSNRGGALAEVQVQVVGYEGVSFSFPSPIAVSPGQHLYIAATGVGDFTAYDQANVNGAEGCFIGRVDGYAPATPEQAPTPPANEAPPAPAPSAPSPTTYAHHVYHTCANGACGLRVRSGPGYGRFAALGVKNDGDGVDIACQTRGEPVFGLDGTSSDVWDRLVDGTFVADFYIDTPGATGSFSPPIPVCGTDAVPASPAASGPSTYTVTSSIGLKRRLAPFIDAGSDGAIAYGASVVVDCQIASESFGGSSVWDRSGPYWYPDAYLTTPGTNGAFSSTIPRCTGDAPAESPATTPSSPVGPAIASGPAPTCKQDIVYIAARGANGNDRGFDEPATVIEGVLLDRYGRARVVLDGLDGTYPAMTIPDGILNIGWGGLSKSVAAGTTAIIADIGFHLARFRSAGCKNPLQVFLEGYSEGAWATGDAYLQMSDDYRSHVAGMVLLGDPRNRGNLLAHGILDAGHPWPKGITGNVWNSCRTLDPICNANAITGPAQALSCLKSRLVCAHFSYANKGQEAEQAGHWLTEKVN